MFYCKRTNTPVTVSSLLDYAFYNPILDEDLFLFETYANCSETSKTEAKETIKLGYVEDDYSNNKPLLSFVNNYLKSKTFNLMDFKKLDVIHYDYFEYDEAVLISVIYLLQ